MNHLTMLTEDLTTKAADKQKLKGYILKWRDGKILMGCAIFLDILKPAAVLCKVLQNDDLCIVSAIEATNVIEKLKSTPFEDLPSVKMVKQS